MTASAGPSTTRNSFSMELMLESTFVSELLQECWFARRHVVDVLHSTVDSFGYDVVLQAGEVVRHVQLKGRQRGGRTRQWAISSQLAAHPAGCVVLIEWEADPVAQRLSLGYRWFGNPPGESLPDLGDKPAKHTKANAQGEKAVRLDRFLVGIARFEEVADMTELAFRLFGPAALVA